jgi:hypothetical protein
MKGIAEGGDHTVISSLTGKKISRLLENKKRIES